MAVSNVGDSVQVDFSFTLLGTTTLADPDEVIVIHRKPDLTETVYTYLTDSEITRISLGLYRIELVLVDARNHIFRPVGIGTVNHSDEIVIEVTESYFLDPLPGP